jgi:hypothetical protein
MSMNRQLSLQFTNPRAAFHCPTGQIEKPPIKQTNKNNATDIHHDLTPHERPQYATNLSKIESTFLAHLVVTCRGLGLGAD